jgi:membrane protease YdiL (CAAX protease family)
MLLVLRRESKEKGIFSAKTFSLPIAVQCVLVGFAANTIISLVIDLIGTNNLPGNYEALVESILGGNSIIVSFLSIGIIVPILEEFIFRGVIFRRIAEKTGNKWIAILVSALMFGIIHLNLVQGTYAFLLGIVMCLIVIWTKSLWSSIAIHMAINGSSVILQNISVSMSEITEIIIICVLLLFELVLFVILYLNRIKSTSPIEETDSSEL